jgi:hypothetical protein
VPGAGRNHQPPHPAGHNYQHHVLFTRRFWNARIQSFQVPRDFFPQHATGTITHAARKPLLAKMRAFSTQIGQITPRVYHPRKEMV